MTNDDRPYSGWGTARLIEERREAQRGVREFERRRTEYKNARSYYLGNDPEFQGIKECLADFERQVTQIDREMDCQQRESRSPVPPRPDPPRETPSIAQPLDRALVAWFRGQRIDSPSQEVTLTWEVNGRHLRGVFARDTGTLEVAVQVADDTPEGNEGDDGKLYMSCNSFAEMHKAVIAEQKGLGGGIYVRR